MFASSSPPSPAARKKPRNPLSIAADLCDPPAWAPRDRPALEPHQKPPAERFGLWLLEAGRGAGKTEACSRYFATAMRRNPGWRGRIIAPTFGDAVESCVTGPSGLLSVDPEILWLPSAPGGAKVVWPNGSEALVLGTPFPKDIDRLRAAGNRHLDWWEEMAANPQLADAHDQAQLGLRLGDHPHAIGSTTPRPTKAYREIRAGAGVVITHGTIDDNPHLSTEWREAIKARYAGTRLGRQELAGELIEDVAGALWTREVLEASRVEQAPALVTVVTAIDPAVSSGPASDDTGIIVAGKGEDGHGYILADRTCHLSPEAWAHKAIRGHYEHDGDRIVGEVNNGGDMIETILRSIDPEIPFKAVRASRGKQTRAEPVAALFGDPPDRPPKVHLVGGFSELEDQLATWVPGEGSSPDRLDALVWAITDLLLTRQSSWRPA